MPTPQHREFVLSAGESVSIGGSVVVSYLGKKEGRHRFGVVAPKQVKISRGGPRDGYAGPKRKGKP